MSTHEPDGIEILDIDDPEAGILAYAVGGTVTEEQAHALFERITAAAADGRKLRLLYDMHGFPSAPPKVLIEKLRLLARMLKTLERVAVIGDQTWLVGYGLFLKLAPFEARVFKRAERDTALGWIRE